MKFKIMVVMLVVTFSVPAFVSKGHARGIKMLVWYPGEAGSTAEAQPVLDAFFRYINTKIAPDTITGAYFNTEEGGLGYIKKDSPTVAIISFSAWTQHRVQIGQAKDILSTRPLPHGTTSESYVLVGPDAKIVPGAKIFSSEPLRIQFARGELFPQIPPDSVISSIHNLLSKLKEIGEGRLKAYAILTPTEAATLGRLDWPWAKALRVVAESRRVSTPRVVIFDAKWEGLARFKSALIAAGSDPNAREVLNEMRLVGFAEE